MCIVEMSLVLSIPYYMTCRVQMMYIILSDLQELVEVEVRIERGGEVFGTGR